MRVDPASTGWANAAPGWRQDQRDAPIELAKSVMAPSFQSSFNVVEGSARTDVSDEAFDACGKKAMKRPGRGQRERHAAGLDGSRARSAGAVKNAVYDVVTAHFNGEYDLATAVQELVNAVEAAQ